MSYALTEWNIKSYQKLLLWNEGNELLKNSFLKKRDILFIKNSLTIMGYHTDTNYPAHKLL